jgi:hypothetical protein
MFDIRYLLIIILLGIIIYLIYSIKSTQTKHFEKLKENITSSIEIEFDDINEKLDNFEEMLDKRLGDCNRKIKDLYSLQNKANEVNKMNNQSIINQFNQFDENMEGLDENEEIKNQIFNSVENSVGNKNNNCFIKINQLKNQEKEMFYMSSDHKNNEFSGTSNIQLAEYENFKTKSHSSSSNVSIKKKSKNNVLNIDIDKESENSTVLEVQDGYIKSDYIKSGSPLANSAYNILNETIIKSSSMGKLNNMDSEDLNGFILEKSDLSKDSNNLQNLEDGDFIIKGIDMIQIMRKSEENSSSYKSSDRSDSISSDDPKILDHNFINLNNLDFNKLGINTHARKSKVIDIE